MYLLNNEHSELNTLNSAAQEKYERHISKAVAVEFDDAIRSDVKVLVIGLGSMGKRRIRNLIANGIAFSNISGYDPQSSRRIEAKDKYKIEILTEIDINSLKNHHLIVISTPPDKHSDYVLLSLEAENHSFVEASN